MTIHQKQNDMNTIKVIKVSQDKSKSLECEMDRKFFQDMVFQAMFYPGSSITIGNYTLSGTTLFIKQANSPAIQKYHNDLKKTVSYLWEKAKRSKSIVFRSKFEQVEYLVQH